MLTLSQSRRISAFTVLRDFVLESGAARFTTVFYVMPDQPRFAVENDGGPAFHFTWFRTTSAAGIRVGGLATLAVDLAIPARALEAITPQIRTEYGLPAGVAVELRTPDFKAGMVELSFAGESGQGDFLNQLAGNGPARLSSRERAVFALDVTADGGALLWRAIEQQLAVIHVRFDLLYDHRPAGVSMRIWCDARRSFPRAETWLGSGGGDLRGLVDALTKDQLSGIELTSDQPLAPEYEKTLRNSGQEILTKALASAMFSQDSRGAGPGLKLRPYSDSMQSSLNVEFTDSYPLEGHAVFDSVLSLDLSEEQFRRRCVQVAAENGFFSLLVVQVVCTVDFSRDLISAVKVVLSYASGAVKRTGEFVFKEGAPGIQQFRADVASPTERTFTYVVEIFYRGDAVPARFSYGPTGTNIIVLDLESAGVLNVTAELRNVPFEIVSKAVVALEYVPKGLKHTIILDAAIPVDSWQAIIRDGPAAYRYRVDWLLQNGNRLEGDWVDTESRTLYLNAPAAISQKAQIQVVSAGDFSGLAQIVVDLRSKADNAETQLAFARAGEAKTWKLKRQSDGEFAYEFRRTLIYEDGTVKAADADWVPETRPVLVIADELRFDVSVIARLLDLGGTLKTVIVELETSAREEEVQKKTILVQSKTDQQRWTFRISKPDQHRYRYRLAAILNDGQRKPASAWQEAENGILVLTLAV